MKTKDTILLKANPDNTRRSTIFFQPKQANASGGLTINQPNDAYEQEADAVADKVMRMPDTSVNNNSFFKPAITSIQRKCAHCEEEEKHVQRKADTNSVMVPDENANYINSLSGGSALSNKDKSFFGARIGYDFSNVKIHTDSNAVKSAQSMNALAYTSGNNIVFGSGQYLPGTEKGKHLLAHELTHVVQQSQNTLPHIQRQPDETNEVPKNEVVEKLENDTLFKKLEKKIKDEIKDAIKTAPEKITQAVLEKIIDTTVTDPQYKEGLKKATEAIIKTITGKKTVSTSKCDAIPGYHEGGSTDFKGQCCSGTIESAQSCCPKDKFAPNNLNYNCCKADEFVNGEGKCEKQPSVDIDTICIPPGKKDSLGKCCMPPFEVIDGACSSPPQKEPESPSSFSLNFRLGVIDDYTINESTLNSRQQPHFDEIKKQIHQFMEACPASAVSITGFADKPGTEEYNQDIGQRRADYIKMLIQLDLVSVNPGGIAPLIFTKSEGENNPVDVKAGERYSAANRRVEIEFNSLCPSLGKPVEKNTGDIFFKPKPFFNF